MNVAYTSCWIFSIARYCVLAKKGRLAFENISNIIARWLPLKMNRIFLSCCIYAVSYTHLDVYKRQEEYEWHVRYDVIRG